MNVHSEWLHRLGASRPHGTASLTPDILDRAGPLPVPSAHEPSDARAARFIAVRVIPLLADDNVRRAMAKANRLLSDAGDVRGISGNSDSGAAAVADARAEAAFWASVRDWARACADEPEPAADPAPRQPVRLPHQRIA